MRAYAILPDAPKGFVLDIDNTLEALQTFVRGYIETWSPFTNWTVICNEEGRLMGMNYCCTIMGQDFVGPVLIVGRKDDEFDDMPFPDEGILRGLLGVK